MIKTHSQVQCVSLKFYIIAFVCLDNKKSIFANNEKYHQVYFTVILLYSHYFG